MQSLQTLIASQMPAGKGSSADEAPSAAVSDNIRPASRREIRPLVHPRDNSEYAVNKIDTDILARQITEVINRQAPIPGSLVEMRCDEKEIWVHLKGDSTLIRQDADYLRAIAVKVFPEHLNPEQWLRFFMEPLSDNRQYDSNESRIVPEA